VSYLSLPYPIGKGKGIFSTEVLFGQVDVGTISQVFYDWQIPAKIPRRSGFFSSAVRRRPPPSGGLCNDSQAPRQHLCTSPKYRLHVECGRRAHSRRQSDMRPCRGASSHVLPRSRTAIRTRPMRSIHQI
jgi:hypothetical protein